MPSITLTEPTFDELRSIFVANPPAEPAPKPAAGVTYTIDRNNYRVDDVMPAGTPGTVQAASGRVYSSPQPGQETTLGYYLRCWKQGGAPDNTAAAAFSMNTYGLTMYWPNNPASWPFAMDQFLHPEAYQTQAQKDAAQAANAAWSAVFALMQKPGGS